ncbi:MAG: hypothetical protein K8T89_02595 [Planctomycetes bacterium]|nr:hypothetical protein [Planctomycetota bacterium]
MSKTTIIFTAIVMLVLAPQGRTCSICDPNFQQRPTMRQSAKLSKFIVLGTLNNARLDGEKGRTDFQIERVIINDPAIEKQKTLTIPAYIPVDPKNPPRYLMFAEFINGRLDIVHSRLTQGTAIADYLKETLRIEDRDRSAVLQFCFKHIDSADAEVSADAFHELAKASDQEIADVARKLAPDKFRKLMKDPKTPADRLGIYAYLLGACGEKADADFLLKFINANDDRGNAALSGLLGGLIELRPEQGWATVGTILRDPKQAFSNKLAALGTIRFYHSCNPTGSRSAILEALTAVVEQGDMADMAIEDLRRWQWWEHTKLIIAQDQKKSHAAPLVRHAILRYALCCPRPEAAEFVKARRIEDAATVKRIESSLEFEKPAPVKSNP